MVDMKRLDESIYFAPMPTKEEYLGYVVATDFKQVVFPTDLSDKETIAGTQLEKRWECHMAYNLVSMT
jgi:hypothetical protein